jgi:predicted RNase H-like HicB family nuclease
MIEAGMIRYAMNIYWSDEDNRFIAEAPELPGCVADGATYEEAAANAQRMIAEWIETARSRGRTVPEPTSRLSSRRDAALGRLRKGFHLSGKQLTRDQVHERK